MPARSIIEVSACIKTALLGVMRRNERGT